jgi:hypothetical protein
MILILIFVNTSSHEFFYKLNVYVKFTFRQYNRSFIENRKYHSDIYYHIDNTIVKIHVQI